MQNPDNVNTIIRWQIIRNIAIDIIKIDPSVFIKN